MTETKPNHATYDSKSKILTVQLPELKWNQFLHVQKPLEPAKLVSLETVDKATCKMHLHVCDRSGFLQCKSSSRPLATLVAPNQTWSYKYPDDESTNSLLNLDEIGSKIRAAKFATQAEATIHVFFQTAGGSNIVTNDFEIIGDEYELDITNLLLTEKSLFKDSDSVALDFDAILIHPTAKLEKILNIVNSRLHIVARRRLQRTLAQKLIDIKNQLRLIQEHIDFVYDTAPFKTVANHTEDVEKRRQLKVERKTMYLIWKDDAFREFQKDKNLYRELVMAELTRRHQEEKRRAEQKAAHDEHIRVAKQKMAEKVERKQKEKQEAERKREQERKRQETARKRREETRRRENEEYWESFWRTHEEQTRKSQGGSGKTNWDRFFKNEFFGYNYGHENKTPSRTAQFKILLLDPTKTYTKVQVRSAYRRQALKLHPDHNKAKNAQEQFNELVNALESVLPICL